MRKNINIQGSKCLNNYFKVTLIHFYRIIKWCILLSIGVMLVLRVGQKPIIILHKLIVIQNSVRWHPYQSSRIIFTSWWQLDQYFSYITLQIHNFFKFGRYFGIVCNHSIANLIQKFDNLSFFQINSNLSIEIVHFVALGKRFPMPY